MSTTRNSSFDRSYLRLNLIFITEAFLYLLTGLILMLLDPFLSYKIAPDSVYILWLFGFVASMVFGITNIMIPTYGNKIGYPKSLIVLELVSLNLGTIASFLGFNIAGLSYLFPFGLTLLIIAVLIHLVDLSSSRLSR